MNLHDNIRRPIKESSFFRLGDVIEIPAGTTITNVTLNTYPQWTTTTVGTLTDDLPQWRVNTTRFFDPPRRLPFEVAGTFYDEWAADDSLVGVDLVATDLGGEAQ